MALHSLVVSLKLIGVDMLSRRQSLSCHEEVSQPAFGCNHAGRMALRPGALLTRHYLALYAYFYYSSWCRRTVYGATNMTSMISGYDSFEHLTVANGPSSVAQTDWLGGSHQLITIRNAAQV